MSLPSLDPNGINSLLILIERIAKNHGLTFIISSHILSNLEQVCTKKLFDEESQIDLFG